MNQLSPLRRAVGMVMMFVGMMWFFIGAGVFGESFLSGQTWFAVLGAAIAIWGLWILTRKPKPESGAVAGSGDVDQAEAAEVRADDEVGPQQQGEDEDHAR